MPTPTHTRVYLEEGKSWTFAAAVDWPGWCRRGKGEDAAVTSLLAYAARYVPVAGPNFAPGRFEVVGRLSGDGAERSYSSKVGARVPPRTPWPEQRAALVAACTVGQMAASVRHPSVCLARPRPCMGDRGQEHHLKWAGTATPAFATGDRRRPPEFSHAVRRSGRWDAHGHLRGHHEAPGFVTPSAALPVAFTGGSAVTGLPLEIESGVRGVHRDRTSAVRSRTWAPPEGGRETVASSSSSSDRARSDRRRALVRVASTLTTRSRRSGRHPFDPEAFTVAATHAVLQPASRDHAFSDGMPEDCRSAVLLDEGPETEGLSSGEIERETE
jgi:hypothetical protein